MVTDPRGLGVRERLPAPQAPADLSADLWLSEDLVSEDLDLGRPGLGRFALGRFAQPLDGSTHQIIGVGVAAGGRRRRRSGLDRRGGGRGRVTAGVDLATAFSRAAGWPRGLAGAVSAGASDALEAAESAALESAAWPRRPADRRACRRPSRPPACPSRSSRRRPWP